MPNRLAAESSLYLRQHANNPVDWYPWGPEALARAAAEDKPIFLSVGYSACHWCHVMEHESFEDATTAAVMNEHFVCVKVDREERPDLDQIYMTALQLLTREGGGWPLSVFLAPDRTPFYAGTYFPPTDKYGRPSFRRLLAAIADAWKTRRGELLEVGGQVTAALNGMGDREAGDGELSADLLKNASRALRRTADGTNGGFGHAPKFPHAIDLRLLLRTAHRFGTDDADIVRLTLEKMARGGMYDQVGGGFHRYSVDAVWLVPHFEKMLYDNALLPPVYVEAYQLTRDPFYRQVACETLDWAMTEMAAVGGGFYSTLDADSEGEEGKFYVWSEEELAAVLGPDAEFARQVFGTSPGGNFEGHNIPCRARPDAEDAKRLGITDDVFAATLARVKKTLYAQRAKRIWPGRDEKLLTAWNGLMIAAFAQAGAVFAEPKYVAAAERAADFVLTNLRSAAGRLYRTCGDDSPAKLSGYLEDYAYLGDGLVALYEATGEGRWLRAATELCDVILTHFRDPAGGFFYTADDHESLIARTRDLHDGSTPSGNAMATLVLLKLAALCDRVDYRDAALATMAVYRGQMAETPAAAATTLLALDFHLGPPTEVALVGPPGPDFDRAKAAVFAKFDPHRVVAMHGPTAEVAVLRDKPPVDGRVTAYICRNYSCSAPLVGADAIVAAFAP